MEKQENYTAEEFQLWLNNHPEVVNIEYYNKHYKSFNDSKLPPTRMDKYFSLYYSDSKSPKLFWWSCFK